MNLASKDTNARTPIVMESNKDQYEILVILLATNYERGRNSEYKCINELREKGYYVERSAGSHKKWDVIAFNKNGLLLVQVKRKKRLIKTNNGWNSFMLTYENKTRQDYETNKQLIPDNAIVSYWVWFDRKGWAKFFYSPGKAHHLFEVKK